MFGQLLVYKRTDEKDEQEGKSENPFEVEIYVVLLNDGLPFSERHHKHETTSTS